MYMKVGVNFFIPKREYRNSTLLNDDLFFKRKEWKFRVFSKMKIETKAGKEEGFFTLYNWRKSKLESR